MLDLDKKGIGSLRSQAIDQLDKSDPELAEAFRNLPESQRAIGRLQGKMLAARGLADMNAVFAWYEQEYGDREWYKPFGWLEKVQIIAAALPLVANVDEKAYRAAVKIWAACQE